MRCTPSGSQPQERHSSQATCIGTATSIESWMGRSRLVPDCTALRPTSPARSAARRTASAPSSAVLCASVLTVFFAAFLASVVARRLGVGRFGPEPVTDFAADLVDLPTALADLPADLAARVAVLPP